MKLRCVDTIKALERLLNQIRSITQYPHYIRTTWRGFNSSPPNPIGPLLFTTREHDTF